MASITTSISFDSNESILSALTKESWVRDRGIFKILLRCGLRVEETANLAHGDVCFRHRLIHIKKGRGNKDPRTIFTFKFWQLALTNIKLVAAFRNPNAVANSLKKRNGFELQKLIELWYAYNKELIELNKHENIFIVDFDAKKMNTTNKYCIS
ncbi:MAG: tyrosine-type recombinase/integrase [Desulfobacteraceae bacterium]|nr:tyrosine-type recombinase/integrase [Desulfobacteraceae bacterium]